MGQASPLRQLEISLPWVLPDTPEGLLRELGGPALLRVAGRDRSRCRALVTLLHGNEPSGLRALHGWLRRGEPPAVDLLCCVGAVEAALVPPGFAHRFLPGRADLNRCFRPPDAARRRGAAPAASRDGEEARLAARILDALRLARPEALIDVHNNTGHNPPYGVGPRAEAVHLNLVGLFGRRFVHSDLRLGALVEVVQQDFPGVTVECGRAGDPAADAVALAGLQAFAERPRLESTRLEVPDMEILVDPVRVCVTPGTRLAFGGKPVEGADLTVHDDVDRHNFEQLRPGVRIGWLADPASWPLRALDPSDRDCSRELFVARDGALETRRPIIPIMMTTHPTVALSDCLFYVVRPGPAAAGNLRKG